MGYQKIVVAVDESSEKSPVFAHATDLARQSNAKLILVHCVPEETSAEAEDRIATLAEMEASHSVRVREKLEQKESQFIRAWLGELCKKAGEVGVEAEAVVEFGKAGPRICELAEQRDADLIVVGRKRRRGIAGYLLGGVSQYVSKHANCSILLVKTKQPH